MRGSTKPGQLQLLRRSTRTVVPTEAGRAYYAEASRLLGELNAADVAASGHNAMPSGLLRVSAPVEYARLHIVPLIAGFLKACPAVQLDISFSDIVVDLAKAEFDLAIRLGGVGNVDLIARKLAPQRRVLCASPAYLSKHGVPATPSDLASHACLLFTYRAGPLRWRFESPGGVVDVEISGPLRADNSDALRAAALADVGLILMPDWLVGADLAAGRLVSVLASYPPEQADAAGVHAVWRPDRRGSSKVRAFVDYLAAHLEGAP